MNTPLIKRDARQTAARAAFLNKDTEASKTAHETGTHSEPERSSAGDVVKPLIFGGIDGIGTSFALVAGASGVRLVPEHILTLGVATLLAGAFSMAVGEYLSSSAERDVAVREMAREAWEVKTHPDGEIREMIDLYISKGLSEEDSISVARTLAKYEDFWIEHMMLHEIGMMVPDVSKSPLKGALAMFSAFIIFGSIPLFAFWLVEDQFGKWLPEARLVVASTAAFLTFFTLGAAKGKLVEQTWWIGGIIMGVQGTAAGGISFLVGSLHL